MCKCILFVQVNSFVCVCVCVCVCVACVCARGACLWGAVHRSRTESLCTYTEVRVSTSCICMCVSASVMCLRLCAAASSAVLLRARVQHTGMYTSSRSSRTDCASHDIIASENKPARIPVLWLEVFARSLPAHPTAPQSHTSRSQLASPKGVLEYLRSSRYIL